MWKHLLSSVLLCYALLGSSLTLYAVPIEMSLPQAETESKFVSGVVIDKKIGETIPGVAVAIWQDGRLVKGASTDIDGNFSIPKPVGTFEVRISLLGYKAVTVADRD